MRLTIQNLFRITHGTLIQTFQSYTNIDHNILFVDITIII